MLLTLKYEHEPSMSENKVVQNMLGVERDEILGEWRRLNSSEFHAFYTSNDIISVIKFR